MSAIKVELELESLENDVSCGNVLLMSKLALEGDLRRRMKNGLSQNNIGKGGDVKDIFLNGNGIYRDFNSFEDQFNYWDERGYLN